MFAGNHSLLVWYACAHVGLIVLTGLWAAARGQSAMTWAMVAAMFGPMAPLALLYMTSQRALQGDEPESARDRASMRNIENIAAMYKAKQRAEMAKNLK